MKSLSNKINESLNEAKISFDDVLAEFKANGFMLTKVKDTNNTYEFAKRNYAKQKGTIEKYGNKTVLTWGNDYKDDAIDNSEIMDLIADFVNENVNESPSYPTKIEILKPIYFPYDVKTGQKTSWTTKKPKDKENKDIQPIKGIFTIRDSYPGALKGTIQYQDEKGMDGPEIFIDNLEDLISQGAIKEIFGFAK